MFHSCTTDLTQFGIIEQMLGALLMEAFVSPDLNRSQLKAPVHVALHRATGVVFLVDSDLNVARANGSVLEDWLACWGCGTEGFPDQVIGDPSGPNFCQRCAC
jgi:hypothetical protein